MAPVATTETFPVSVTNGGAKAPVKAPVKLFNPFDYISGDEDDGDYQFAHYKVRAFPKLHHLDILLSIYVFLTMSSQPSFPDVKWPPLTEVPVIDRGLFADPEKKALLSAATKVTHLTPAIGTELSGIDLRQLTDAQKDELCVPHL